MKTEIETSEIVPKIAESVRLSVIDLLGTLLPGSGWLILFGTTYRLVYAGPGDNWLSPVGTVMQTIRYDGPWARAVPILLLEILFLGFAMKPLQNSLAQGIARRLWRIGPWVLLFADRKSWYIEFRGTQIALKREIRNAAAEDRKKLRDPFSFPFAPVFDAIAPDESKLLRERLSPSKKVVANEKVAVNEAAAAKEVAATSTPKEPIGLSSLARRYCETACALTLVRK